MKISRHLISIMVIWMVLLPIFSNLITESNLGSLESYAPDSLRLQGSTRQKKLVQFTNITLNDSVSFKLNATEYCNEVHLNFTSINQTKDFILNGNLSSSADEWKALNLTDINYEWVSEGPGNANCIKINLTGNNSKQFKYPLNNNSRGLNFSSDEGWIYKNNDSAYFEVGKVQPGRDPITGGLNYPTDATGSLIHNYSRTDIGMRGKANSSYEVFYDDSLPIYYVNLSFWYYWSIPDAGNNEITFGVLISTPSNDTFLINETSKLLATSSPIDSKFKQMIFPNISTYFNETGNYSLHFFSEHYHESMFQFPSEIYFDDILLEYVYCYNKINKSDWLSWNQSLDFDRNVFTDGILNFSYYLTEKFDHINSSKVALGVNLNGQQYVVENLQNISSNEWIKESLMINRSLISGDVINVSIGLFFNDTINIYPNETISLYLDNISFFIGTNPKPEQIALESYVPHPEVAQSFQVVRDAFGNDFVNITKPNFKWGPNQVHWLNLTSNSSDILVNLTLSYFVFEIKEIPNTVPEVTPPPSQEPINVTILFLILILMMSISSFLVTIRIQKRIFINPKYDYIKKLRFRKRLKRKGEGDVPIMERKACTSCGHMINKYAKFCERCGQSQ